jgi:hypothetical protein
MHLPKVCAVRAVQRCCMTRLTGVGWGWPTHKVSFRVFHALHVDLLRQAVDTNMDACGYAQTRKHALRVVQGL